MGAFVNRAGISRRTLAHSGHEGLVVALAGAIAAAPRKGDDRLIVMVDNSHLSGNAQYKILEALDALASVCLAGDMDHAAFDLVHLDRKPRLLVVTRVCTREPSASFVPKLLAERVPKSLERIVSREIIVGMGSTRSSYDL